jgi:DNA polymerase-3 subunit beta
VTPLKDSEALKASITLANLKHALRITSMANPKASLIPTLQGVRMEQIESGLALEATDLDVAIRVVLPELCGPQKPLITTAAKLTDWAKLLTGDQDVQISADANRATVKCGRAKVQLPVIPASNWPEMPFDQKLDGVTLTQGPLTRALKFAQVSIGDDEKGYTLSAAHIEGDGKRLQVVATTGHTLMAYSIPSDAKINLLLPARFVKVLLPLLADENGGVELAANEAKIAATIDADFKTQIAHGRLAGQFPKWQSLIPKDPATVVKVKSADLLAPLDRVFLLTDEKGRAVDFVFTQNEITMRAANSADGEAEDSTPCECPLAAGEEYKIRLNPVYVRDLLRKLDGEVVIELPAGSGKPALFKAQPHEGESFDYVVMPMRG